MRIGRRWFWLVCAAPLLAWGIVAGAQQPADEKPANSAGAAGKASPGAVMEYGPYLTSSLVLGEPKSSAVVAYKSLNIKVGNGAVVAFDTDTLRYAAGWTGGFLDVSKTHLTTPKGDGPPRPGGKLAFAMKDGPGWGGAEGSLADPRVDPQAPGLGPLPKSQAHYRGLYLHGNNVVLSYGVGTSNVLELPGSIRIGGEVAFVRIVQVDRAQRPRVMVIGDAREGLHAAVAGGTGVKVEVREGRVVAVIPAGDRPVGFVVVFGRFDRASLEGAARSLAIPLTPADLIKGGPPRWGKAIVTRGAVGKPQGDFPYAVDTLTLPFDNPYSAWMRVTAFDFFPDGKSAALCTWNGDVWVVSGIDDALSKLTWRRFASGLYEPLGLKVVNGLVHVTGRDQVTRLHDLNGDGEADFYENVNNDLLTCHQYHHFKFELQTDAAGNLYWIMGGAWNTTPFARDYSWLVRLSPDGEKLEKIARGFRAPNGFAVGPAGEIVVGDNQGHWMPASKINYIAPGKTGTFHGFPSDPRVAAKDFDAAKVYPAGVPKEFEPPLCWIPYTLDTSSGGQAFVTSDKWGPFKGAIVHASYGKSALFVVPWEVVDGVAQGGVWQMPLKFESGIQRARFNPVDGQLYVAGLRGWQTGGAKDGCFQRIRYTGGRVMAPSGLRATRKGVYVTFGGALDPVAAGDVGNFDVEQWNYRWSEAYGSPEYSVEDGSKKGRDTAEVESVKLQPDGRTIFLSVPKIGPVMQMKIAYHLKSADGKPVDGVIHNTINRLGKDDIDTGGAPVLRGR